MEKEFIPYKLNRELYALGCIPKRKAFAYYTTPFHPTLNSGVFMNDNPDPVYEWELKKTNKNLMYNSAILWQEAFRWFKEIYNLRGYVIDTNMFDTYSFMITNKNNKDFLNEGIDYSTYEEAELACLRKLIEIVKQKE